MPQSSNITPNTLIEKKISYHALSKRVFSGEICRFNTPNSELITSARALICRVFNTDKPEKAHTLYDKDTFHLLAKNAQDEFNTDVYRQQFEKWLNQLGIDCSGIYWDTLGLRVAPPVQTHKGGFRSTTNVHRDTWGTAIQNQVNWWAPIYPLTNGRTMQFFLDYWDKPLANNTGTWSFQEFLAERKKAVAAGKAASYPSVPSATERPKSKSSLVRIDCNEIIAFSAAHLHSSVTNQTAYTRYSFEIRTVNPKQKITAPNVDCLSNPPLYRLFRSCQDAQVKMSPPDSN